MRLAASRCIAIESSRGWRITKEKQWREVDVMVALAMAAFAAVQGRDESSYDATCRGFCDDARRRRRVGSSLVSGHERRRRRTKAARAQFGPTVSFPWDGYPW